MTTTNNVTRTPAPGNSSCHDASHDSGSWLRRHRNLMIGGAVVTAAVILALTQNWLALANLVPLLFVLPCALMMLKCMKGSHHGQQSQDEPTAARPEASVASHFQS